MRIAVLGLVCLIACGSDSGAISMSDAKTQCTRICQHDITCGSGSTLDTCITNCTADTTGVVREDALEDFATCIENQSCTDSMADCLAECVPTSTHESFETHCRAKLAECGIAEAPICETMPSVGADDSEVICLLAPSVLDELDACFTLDCASIGSCVQGFLSRYGFSV